MAGWPEAASGALTLLAFWSAFPRYADLGVIQEETLGSIITTPTPMTIASMSPAGTAVATLSVSGGAGSYTYTLVDPSGYFTIVGNQIQVSATPPMTVGSYPILITAYGSTGDIIQLPTSIIVTPGGYAPTYFLIGF